MSFASSALRLSVAALVLAVGGGADAQCVGDCDATGRVAINELIIGVSIALGRAPLRDCAAFDPNASGSVTIEELIAAVNAALSGCPPTLPTDTPTPETPATSTAVATATWSHTPQPTDTSPPATATPIVTPSAPPTMTGR